VQSYCLPHKPAACNFRHACRNKEKQGEDDLRQEWNQECTEISSERYAACVALRWTLSPAAHLR
jgi:hypothetical protein